LVSAAPPRTGLGAALVGIVHGLGGSAALTLMTLSTLHEAPRALAYLGAFGLGSMGGMLAVTVAFALPLREAGRRAPNLLRWLTVTTCSLSIGAGVLAAYRLLEPGA